MAPWIMAGALLLSAGVPVAAQDETPAAEAGTEGALPAADEAAADPAAVEAAPADPAAAPAPATDQAAAPAPAADAAAAEDSGGDREGRGGRGDQEVAAVPAVGVGPGTVGGGLNAFAIGAAVSAAAAGAAALRGRFGTR
jgi:hypothetical protein